MLTYDHNVKVSFFTKFGKKVPNEANLSSHINFSLWKGTLLVHEVIEGASGSLPDVHFTLIGYNKPPRQPSSQQHKATYVEINQLGHCPLR